MLTTLATDQVHIIEGGAGREEEYSEESQRTIMDFPHSMQSSISVGSGVRAQEVSGEAPPVGAELQSQSEGLVAPAHKHHAGVTWSPESLRGDGTRVERRGRRPRGKVQSMPVIGCYLSR